jgi:hypothetical protein
MLTTPGGAGIDQNFVEPQRGERRSLGGFKTTVQPVARAGPIFQMQAPSDPFHGMIAPTTPTGSFSV